jgi:acyl-CoA hydrolase
MQNYVNVRHEHLNLHGYLFGGQMLKWLDEFAWMAASLDFPGSTFVTAGIDGIVFKHRVVNGSILRFEIEPERIGKTSVTYSVVVHCDEPGATCEKEVFSCHVTFVNIGNDARPAPLTKKSSK